MYMIYSCLLIFPDNIDDNYIITSTLCESDDNDKSATKIYSLNNGQFIKYINNTKKNIHRGGTYLDFYRNK